MMPAASKFVVSSLTMRATASKSPDTALMLPGASLNRNGPSSATPCQSDWAELRESPLVLSICELRTVATPLPSTPAEPPGTSPKFKYRPSQRDPIKPVFRKSLAAVNLSTNAGVCTVTLADAWKPLHAPVTDAEPIPIPFTVPSVPTVTTIGSLEVQTIAGLVVTSTLGWSELL